MLPLISGEAAVTPKEYLYVFIDDYSRVTFADILPDQTSYSAAIVLDEAIQMMPFRMETIYSDNGKEFKRHRFLSREERRRILYAIVRYYNHLRPHQSLDGMTPFGALENYVKQTKVELKELSESVTNA